MGQNASGATRAQTNATEDLKPPDDPPPEKKKTVKTQEERNALITQGCVFTRYSIDRGEPSCNLVLVSYHQETKSICWTLPDSIRYDPLHSMKIKDILQVVHGKQTAALRSSLAAEAPSHLCFSIISKSHQSIDLEASEATVADEFADAVDCIKGKEARCKKSYSLPAPPFQMPITQASLSQILNASLLLTNKKLKLPKKSVSKKSRKTGKSAKPSPSIHSSTTLLVATATTHAPPTCRLQGYTKKKMRGKKRKTTKSSPLVSAKVPSAAPRQTAVVPLPEEVPSDRLVEFGVIALEETLSVET